MVDLDSKDLEQFIKFHTGENMIQKKSAWETFKGKDKLLLLLLGIAGLLAAAAVFVLITPATTFILNLFDLYIDGWAQLSSWLLTGDMGLAVALALGFLSLIFLLLARFRYVRDRSAYIEAGCPACHEHELIRVRRYRRDRLFGFFGIPVRRYACRNCTWNGTRLAKFSQKAVVENDAQDAGMVFEDETQPGNGTIDISEETLVEMSETPNLEILN